MEYRQLGGSDLKVSAIVLGAWAIGGFMWGGTDDEEAVKAIHRAIDSGVTTIDTAPIYGMGHSEEIVGRAIKGRRERLQILTKFGMAWEGDLGRRHFETLDVNGKRVSIGRNGGRARVIAECENSLRRLGVDHIDLYQQHWPDPGTPVEETFGAVSKLLEQGKIRAAGVSNFSIEQLEAAAKIVPIVSVQSPYSMVNRGLEGDLLPYCREHNVGFLAYSPLQRGLLTGKVTVDREFPETDHRHNNPYFTKENRRRVLDLLSKIEPIASEHDATLAQLVIRWTIGRPGVTAALVGARNEKQATENAAAAGIELTQEEIARIGTLLEEVKLDV
jgi:aryl-alcohol dehydrogenase-like predicted oxidoreductase